MAESEIAVRERPILFSGPMVRALLAGTKTQTRRPVKGEALAWLNESGFTPEFVASPENGLCPYGKPGDRLWVREAFSGPHIMERTDDLPAMPPSEWPKESQIWYWADGEPTWGDWTRPRPSIHMPRWASRITVEVTEVRVERLQDISESDALAEGIVPRDVIVDTAYEGGGHVEKRAERFMHGEWPCDVFESAAEAYADLWEQINGAGSWNRNDWIWAISFRRINPA